MDRVRSAEFWQAPTVADLEAVRSNLRGVMQYRTPMRPDGRRCRSWWTSQQEPGQRRVRASTR